MTKSDKSELQKFGLFFSSMMGVAATLFFLKGSAVYPLFIFAAVIVVTASIVNPHYLKPLKNGLNYLGMTVSTALSFSAIVVIYFFIITPIGLLLRVFGVRFLDLNFRTQESSYWRQKDEGDISLEQYKKQF
jgi:hypothetical protein